MQQELVVQATSTDSRLDGNSRINDSLEEVILLKLLPQQVEMFWDKIKEAMDASLPSSVAINKANLLASILDDRVQIWLICSTGSSGKLRGILSTVILDDPNSGTRDCLVFMAHTFLPVSVEGWGDIDRALIKFAQGNRCDRITTISDEPRVIKLMEYFGYDTSYRFIQKEVPR